MRCGKSVIIITANLRKVLYVRHFAYIYICTFGKKILSLHRISGYMNIVTTILLVGAAYLYLSGRKEQERLNNVIDDLNKKNDELAADLVVSESKNDDLKDEFLGDLKDRITCVMRAYVSRINPMYKGRFWNSEFLLDIKNISSQPITIGAIRVFWSVEGRKSSLVPWTTSTYTINPGQKITIRLYGFNNKNHFLNDSDIDYIQSELISEGFNPTIRDQYMHAIRMNCEMDVVQVANGQKFAHVYKGKDGKGFNGALYAHTDGRVYSPFKWENGTDIQAINEVMAKKKDEQK